ncbi:MAG: tRNA (guanosine(37)-N1)-methyltransferase TrmD [Deltaproteobacteria bacterium]|nr:tRNA (guanosine(37)-N1)-methyltransferase TrmD [Deltaproteobacteria bacterium]
MIRFDVLTLFPGMFESPLRESLLGKARQAGRIEIVVHNIRDFAEGRHRIVDDTPYGGGGGMVMKPEPIVRCIESIKKPYPSARVILMSPQGVLLDDGHVRRLARHSHLVLVCRRYEGVDERVRLGFVDEELSIGDYVLTGGELAAMVVIDAVSRLVPGVLGYEKAADEDSFANGLLEYPQYTKPRDFRGLRVPEILISGNHQAIREWRRRESIRRTGLRRRDLLEKARLSAEERKVLEE